MEKYTVLGIEKENYRCKALMSFENEDELLIRTLTFYKTVPNGDNIYPNNEDLNRFHINRAILNYILESQEYDLAWMLNPRFIDINMAIRLSDAGLGEYIPARFDEFNEFLVYRYMNDEDVFDKVRDINAFESEASKVVNARKYISKVIKNGNSPFIKNLRDERRKEKNKRNIPRKSKLTLLNEEYKSLTDEENRHYDELSKIVSRRNKVLSLIKEEKDKNKK